MYSNPNWFSLPNEKEPYNFTVNNVHVIRTSSLPYGELPSDLQVDVHPASEVGAPTPSTSKTNGAINAEQRREPGWSADIGANRTETGDDETLRESLAAPENTESPSVNVDTLAVDPSSQAVDETSPADTVRGQSSPQRTHTDGAGEDETGQASGSQEASPDLRGDHRRHDKPPRLPIERDDRNLSLTDSQDEEIIAPYMHSSTRIAQSYDDARYTSSKNYHLKRRTIRRREFSILIMKQYVYCSNPSIVLSVLT